MSCVGPYFCDFADGMLLRARDVAVVLHSYFDESVTGNILCVAGYLYTKRNARLLQRDWDAMLRRWGLPYFRMSACAHGSAPLDKLSKPQRVLVQTQAINLVKKYAQMGVAVTVDEAALDAAMPSAQGLPRSVAIGITGAYELCVWLCMQRISHSVTDASARIGYFFEQGHRHQKRANLMMAEILGNEELKRSYRSVGFGFIPKESGGPIQSADILAWQWAKDRKNQADGRPRRADLRSLLERGVIHLHIDAEAHAQLVRDIISRESEAFAAALSSS